MTRKEILHEAEKIICHDREEQYGEVENNFGLIGRLWQEYLKARCVGIGAEVRIEPEDVANLMALLKIARIATGNYKADSYVDACGYLACGGELAAVEEPTEPEPIRGKWVYHRDKEGFTYKASCSECLFEIEFATDQTERCPRCDAEMANPCEGL